MYSCAGLVFSGVKRMVLLFLIHPMMNPIIQETEPCSEEAYIQHKLYLILFWGLIGSYIRVLSKGVYTDLFHTCGTQFSLAVPVVVFVKLICVGKGGQNILDRKVFHWNI